MCFSMNRILSNSIYVQKLLKGDSLLSGCTSEFSSEKFTQVTLLLEWKTVKANQKDVG